MKRLLGAVAVIGLTASMAQAQAAKVDSSIAAYQKVSGVSGNINSVGSDTMNNMMALWGETFQKLYPNVKIQVEGKGSSTAPAALIAGTAQFGPMSRAMRATEIDQFESKYGYKPTQLRTLLRRPRRLRQQGQPHREAHPRPGGRGLLQVPEARLQAERHHLGPARPHRRLGQPPDQPLRPQLRLRHLRVLQGAHPRQRRLQGQREGAARLGLRGPGRHRGPLRHGLLGHRLQDLRRQGRAPRREGGRRLLRRQLRGRQVAASIRSPGSSTSTSTGLPASRSIPS